MSELSPLDGIRFNKGLSGEPQTDNLERVWTLPAPDGLTLSALVQFVPLPPDLPDDAKSATDLEQHFDEQTRRSPAQLLGVALREVDGLNAVETMLAIRNDTSVNVAGTLIIPFRDFSFMVKVQASETPGGPADAGSGDGGNGAHSRPAGAAARELVRTTLDTLTASCQLAREIKAAPHFPLPSAPPPE